MAASRDAFSTAGIARLTARHPWRVIAVWVVILALSGIAATGLSNALTTSTDFTSNPESRVGSTLLQRGFPGPETVSETVVIHSDGLTVNDPAFAQVVEQTVRTLTGMPAVVQSVVSYQQLRATGQSTSALVSQDGHTTILPVTLAGSQREAKAHADQYIATVEGLSTPQVRVMTVGDASANQAFTQLAATDLRHGELITLPPTLLILLVVFGALVAAGIPVVLSLVSILSALGLTALAGHFIDISFFVVNMITMIGLAVGIDYTLFIISRYREERRAGIERHAAIGVAGATASKAVLFSGITVLLALSGLILMPTTLFRSLGIGAVFVVLTAIVATLTLVPALLALLGDRIDWPRRTVAPEQPAATAEPPTRGFWVGLTRVVMARPVVSLVLATLLLVALALPFKDLQRGSSGIESLPPGNVKDAYVLLQQNFSAGLLAPVQIVVQASNDDTTQAAINRLVGGLRQDPAFVPQPQVRWDSANDLAEITIPLKVSANSSAAYAAIRHLRHDLIPAAFAASGAHVYVTGQAAINLDLLDLINHYTPLIFGYVLGLSFLLLLLAFRSIVVPVKAILMNLLSVGAAYGIMVLVFQKGYLHSLFGFQRTPNIEDWVPIFLFCILFGLSMDYHVFLLSRIREHYDRTHDNRESVMVGLLSTARIITGAALIMVVVFSGFAMGKLVMLQQVGFGLAVAILIDATIVRTIIVPSAMILLGDVNWYLPRWLDWLPDLRIEGNAPAPLRETAPTAGED